MVLDGAPRSCESLIIGNSRSLREVLCQVRQIANSSMPVMILGETGTGKELIAQAIHGYSLRKAKPFVSINCAAIMDTLAESELFGHEKGAFSGAIQQQPGKFELADGGTLFLDEIKELPLTQQSKVLRALQEGQFYRLGGRNLVKVDVRVICATNSDLRQAVKDKTFRQDLFFRLRGAQIILPPLRDRKEDILLLAEHFLKKYNEQDRTNVSAGFDVADNHIVQKLEPGDLVITADTR